MKPRGKLTLQVVFLWFSRPFSPKIGLFCWISSVASNTSEKKRVPFRQYVQSPWHTSKDLGWSQLRPHAFASYIWFHVGGIQWPSWVVNIQGFGSQKWSHRSSQTFQLGKASIFYKHLYRFHCHVSLPHRGSDRCKETSLSSTSTFKRPTFLFHLGHSDFKEHNATQKRNLVNQACLHNTNRYQRIQCYFQVFRYHSICQSTPWFWRFLPF